MSNNATVSKVRDYQPSHGRIAPTRQRLNLALPAPFVEELKNFSAETGRSIGGAIRWMFGLSKVLSDEFQAGNRVVIVDKDGNILKEIAYPR